MKRAARYTLIGAAVLAVLVLGLVVLLTRTDFGVERAGRFALDQIRGSINGELQVDRMTSDGLLSGVTLHGVAIRDPEGRPFVLADSARLTYRLRTLLGGSIVFDRIIVHEPEVTIERLPGEEQWNYQRLFASDTTAPDTTTQENLVLIEDATIHGGRVLVRMPWEPDGPVEPGDTARLILESVPGGLVRTLRFEEVEARAPRIVWEAPEEEGKLIEVAELSTRAYIWETPAEIEALEGVVTIRDSLISFDAPRARLPNSELALVGRIILADDENRYDIEVDGQDVAFSDFQWLYPALPTTGGGTLQFRMQTQGPGSMLWLAREARLQTRGTELAGSFGVVTGDTLYFTNVDLEASPLDLDLLQQLVPTELPLEGLLIGTVEIEGPVSSLQTRGDVRLRTFREGEGAESRLRWDGRVGLRPPYTVRGLTAQARELDLEQVAQFAPALRLRGLATGRIEASGSVERGIDVTGELALDREGGRSAIRGSGRFAVGGDRSAFDLRFDTEPLALDLLTEQFPELGRFAGDAQGPVMVTGSLDDLRVDADLNTPAGALRVLGSLSLTGPAPRYRAEGSVTDFELDRVATDLPQTRVTGRFSFQGEGDRPETLSASGSLDVLTAQVAGVEVGPSTARGSIANGLLRFDSLGVRTEVGELTGAGSLGIIEDRSGELAVTANAHTLSALEPLFFPAEPLTDLGAEVEPRLAGAATAEAVITGSIGQWRARGRATARELVYDELEVGTVLADFDGGLDAFSADLSADSLRYQHRRVPHLRATLERSASAGRLVARARGLDGHRVEVEGGFLQSEEGVEVQLRQLALAMPGGQWTVADTVEARIARDGIAVDSLVLVRSPHHARIRLAGVLPWRSPDTDGPLSADMRLELDSVRVGELLRLTQTDTLVDGVVTGRFRVDGTATAPRLEGQIVSRPFRYAGAVLDSAGGNLTYRDRLVRTGFAGWEGSDAVVSGVGAIPLDLALRDVPERRLDAPMSLRFLADSIPAGLVSFLAPGFDDFDGAVDGQLAIVGTTRSPALEGELRLLDGSARFRPLNVRYRRMNVTARMGQGRLVEIDGRLATEHGSAQVQGTLDVTEPGDPGFDLVVRARELDAARRADVVAVATGDARLQGRYTRPIVSGDVEIVSGEMNLDEVWRQYQVVQLDPTLFQMFDSTTVRFRPPAEIPFLENMLLTDVTLRTERDFWLRSRELNVEVSGDLEVEVDRQVGDFRLTGALQAVDGNYALQLAQVPARMFDIRGGSIEFVGTPGIDPNLSIEAAYRVRREQGDPIDVMAQVSGTLKDPRVRLTSDTDLPLSESDLASYILFGRSGAELSQAESEVVSSGIGLVRPVATGVLSTTLQDLAAWTGIVDYVAFTTPEYGLEQWQERGVRGLLHNTQLEVGIDAGRYWSLVGMVRYVPTDGTAPAEATSPLRIAGARVEWRFRPTWTTELYLEDRFARTPSFGLTEIDDRKVLGISVFRDWGY